MAASETLALRRSPTQRFAAHELVVLDLRSESPGTVAAEGLRIRGAETTSATMSCTPHICCTLLHGRCTPCLPGGAHTCIGTSYIDYTRCTCLYGTCTCAPWQRSSAVSACGFNLCLTHDIIVSLQNSQMYPPLVSTICSPGRGTSPATIALCGNFAGS